MLDEIRSRIDKIDDELIRLFAQRILLAEEVARQKMAKKLPVANAAREREIISRLTKGQSDDMTEYIQRLYATIFELSRTHQTRLTGQTPRE